MPLGKVVLGRRYGEVRERGDIYAKFKQSVCQSVSENFLFPLESPLSSDRRMTETSWELHQSLSLLLFPTDRSQIHNNRLYFNTTFCWYTRLT